jgi:hypothetical protein
VIRVPCPRRASEEGAVLILALVFLVAIGLVLMTLVSLAGTNLAVTSNLQAQRNLEYYADALVDGAIQAVRHEAPSSITNPTCPNFASWPSPPAPAGNNLVVDCAMGIPTTGTPPVPSFYGRIVEFDACPVASPPLSFSSCQSAAIVRANVVFNDVSNAPGCSGTIPSCYGGFPGFWGTGMTLESWTVQTANH